MSIVVPPLQLRVTRVDTVAIDTITLELRAAGDADLPIFEAGAHIDLRLDNNLVRSYSLLNDPRERHRYVIAVHKSATGRGGSAYVHEMLRAGAEIGVDGPRNNFPLDERATRSELIAGGIGITPILAMIRRLEVLGRDWHLHYCARTRDHAAFHEELRAYGNRVDFNFDQEPGGQLLDLRAVVAASPADTHFYCCGPLPMLAAFESAVDTVPDRYAHLEYFSAKAPEPEPIAAQSFAVSLARSGHRFTVEPGETILDKLIDLGFDISYSCREGVCGSCETGVLEGQPDHRDLVLGKAEKAAGKTMMVCCSGCKSDNLVLDL